MNKFKTKIENKEKPIGIFADMCSCYAVEAIGKSGFDYIIIDNEHSPIEAETSAEMIRACELSGVTPFCRIREISRPAVLKLLDVGAQGLIVPNVNTLEDVKQLVSFCKYKPIGNRGFCPSRKDGWGFDLNMSVAETMAYFNNEVLLVPQCETVGALENIEEIAATEGVDGIFVGPFDLSISMGMPGDFKNPIFLAALERVQKACRDAGKFCILFTGTAEGVTDGFARGFDSMTYSTDAGLLIECFKEKIKNIREQ